MAQPLLFQISVSEGPIDIAAFVKPSEAANRIDADI
jgi:hypothetical protein